MGDNSKFYRWYDEPDFISISIEKNYLKKLIEIALKKTGTIENLSRITRISKATIHTYKKGIGMNVKNFKILLNFLNINYNRVNHKIEKIGWNQKKININLNSNKMAVILAASLADGHLNNSHFMYKNKNKELIKRVKECVNDLFGNIKISERVDRNGTDHILCPSFVKRQLERLGSPKGKKLFQNPSIPEIIKKGNKPQKKFFIQQFFDDEGWPEVENKRIACCQAVETTNVFSRRFINNLILGRSYSINKIPKKWRFNILKPNLLLDLRDLLKQDFGITTNLNLKRIVKRIWKGDKIYISAIWELSCIRKADIKKFEKEISFFSSDKKSILKKLLEEKQVPKDIFLRLLNASIKLHNEKDCFSVRDIQEHVDLNLGQIRKRLGTLAKQEILYNDGGRYSLRLKLK